MEQVQIKNHVMIEKIMEQKIHYVQIVVQVYQMYHVELQIYEKHILRMVKKQHHG